MIEPRGKERRLRIVSLLPSATEIVCSLGLGEQLAAVTHECDYPPFVRRLPKATRTLIPADAPSAEIDRLVRERLAEAQALYTLDFATLEALGPDLIVTQALCEVCAVAEDEVQAAVRRLPGRPRVVNLEPENLAQVMDAIREVARAAGVEANGEETVRALAARVDAVASRSAEVRHRPRVALLEWLDPPFSCGHWSPELVRLAGGVEVLGHEGRRSRTLSWDEVASAAPDVLFVACCGFDLDRTLADLDGLRGRPEFKELAAVRSGRVYVADGSQYFSRPGPRLVDSLEILGHALHPERHALPPGLPAAVALAEVPGS
jgi:iron complex transport system substrate-binding protein